MARANAIRVSGPLQTTGRSTTAARSTALASFKRPVPPWLDSSLPPGDQRLPSPTRCRPPARGASVLPLTAVHGTTDPLAAAGRPEDGVSLTGLGGAPADDLALVVDNGGVAVPPAGAITPRHVPTTCPRSLVETAAVEYFELPHRVGRRLLGRAPGTAEGSGNRWSPVRFVVPHPRDAEARLRRERDHEQGDDHPRGGAFIKACLGPHRRLPARPRRAAPCRPGNPRSGRSSSRP